MAERSGDGSHAGFDGSRWRTVRACRTVVGVARTTQSTTRVLDAVGLFRADHRVQAVFAVDESSRFSRGVSRLLADVGALVLPWSELDAVDLVVSASENVAVPLRAPMIVVPHGVGFHKYVPDANGRGRRVSGLVSDATLRERRVLMAVSHQDQVSQLAALSPATVGRTAVVGDLTLDQLVASRTLRSQYRGALGVGEGQRLVVVSSTWGEQSQFGRWPRLAERLLSELPADEYRVAQIVHPNVSARHGDLQLRSWLADALDAGLLLIPPSAGWQATLASAHVAVCDHGSLALYAAALGIPLILAGFGDEVVPDTALAVLDRVAAHLDPGHPLREQIVRAEADEHRARLVEVSDLAFENRGEAAARLRALMYELMRLRPPASSPRPRAAPAPLPECRQVLSHVVHADVAATAAGLAVSLRRYPAPLEAAGRHERPGTLRHLVADAHEPDRWVATNAAVVVSRQPVEPAEARSWAERALSAFPGSQLAAAATAAGHVVVTRAGLRAQVRPSAAGPVDPAPALPDPALTASAIYALDRRRMLADTPVLLGVGPRAWTLEVRVSA